MSLLVLDVDGVLTDGTKAYDKDGVVLWKRFADIDWTAIKKFQSQGWAVCLLSADKNINEAVAKDRDIDFWYSRDEDGTIDKVKWLAKLIQHYAVNKNDMLTYVGDDLFDIPIMMAVLDAGGQVFCPLNSAPQLINHHRIKLLNKRGGNGVIMELYYRYYKDDKTPPKH